MATTKELSPEELTAAIAWWEKTKPINNAWYQQETVSASKIQADAATALAVEARKETEALAVRLAENNQREDIRTVMNAAVAIAVDVTSSLDGKFTVDERDKRATDRAFAMWTQCNQLMKKP